jgi:hypothetical protein
MRRILVLVTVSVAVSLAITAVAFLMILSDRFRAEVPS